MKVSELKIYQLKPGMKLYDPDTQMHGVITFVEHDMIDTYTYVKWEEGSERTSGFWGNHVDYEVVE